MRKIFYDDDILLKYEREERWTETIEYLNHLVYSCPHNKSILYRLAAQNWYVLTFWNCNMPIDKLDRKFFESSLQRAYIIAKENYWTDSNCLWLFGYFMCINQVDFSYISTDIREVEREGNNLISVAYFNNPNNQLAELLFLADNGNKRKYAEAVNKCKKNIFIYFPHQSAIEQYFIGIFSDEHL